MAGRFDYFIIFAEMRTGSNFLETNLNAYPGLICHGEAFNPHFIGYPNRTEILGITQPMRDADPVCLIDAVRQRSAGLGGFRFFHDHDPRILDLALSDPRCAKIILTRNPVDSYVSWKIAQATGQWKLTNVTKRKDALAVFDGPEFEAHLAALQEFQIRLLHSLQITGQTAFHVAYEDLQDVAVMNGLARFLGVMHQLETLDESLKKQNPEPISEKVANFDQMQEVLARLDRFNLTRTPNFEPRRGAAVPGYVAAPQTPLLYLPIRSGPEGQVLKWLAALDRGGPHDLQSGFTQKTLRQWLRSQPGHRSFTVLRHPAARAHAVFCERILSTGPGHYAEIRKILRKSHGLCIPKESPGPDYDKAAHRRAFIAFLEFLKVNLAGQTMVRVDAAWATQMQVLQGYAQFVMPDMILREDEIEVYLPALAQQMGHDDPPTPEQAPQDEPFALAEIYDSEVEELVSAVYQRDYIAFGFGPWSPLA
jgi:LPS sulfotransferase NodH